MEELEEILCVCIYDIDGTYTFVPKKDYEQNPPRGTFIVRDLRTRNLTN